MNRIVNHDLESRRVGIKQYGVLIALVILLLLSFFTSSTWTQRISTDHERFDQVIYSQLRVMCYTHDLDGIIYYYTKVLEFDIIDSWGSGVMFEVGNNIIEYFEGDAHPTSFFISIEVNDVDELWERKKVYTEWISFELRDNPWGDRSFGLKDPNGSQLVFFSRH